MMSFEHYLIEVSPGVYRASRDRREGGQSLVTVPKHAERYTLGGASWLAGRGHRVVHESEVR